jgi:hypothetical protein
VTADGYAHDIYPQRPGTRPNFAGNDNDLAAPGNVHKAVYSESFPGLTESGDYQTIVTGTIKGNTGSVIQPFSVTYKGLVIGGCSE